MKAKKLRTICVVILALIMSLTMGTSVFATNDLGQDDSINPDKPGTISNGGVKQNGQDSGEKDSDNKATHGVYQRIGETVTLDKEIIIFNTRSDNTVVYLPNIKYEYTVAAATASEIGTGKQITDEYGLKGAVNPGEPNAIDNGSTKPYVEFSNTAGITGTGMTTDDTKYVTTNTSGEKAEGHFDLKFKESAFTKPGVYRYKITETTAENARAEAGVTNNSYNNVRYLDVYVQNNSTNTAYEIYGYVCFEAAASKEFDAKDKPLTEKTNGFVSEKNDGDETTYSKDEVSVDIYETSNVKIQKIITGTMADKNNEFPFSAKLKNGTITANPIVSYTIVNDTNTTLVTTGATPNFTLSNGEGSIGNSASATVQNNLKLNDEDYVYIYGIPGKNVATKVTTGTGEFNNTVEEYTVSATYDGSAINVTDNDETNKASVQLEASNAANLAADQTIDITKTEDTLVVTNKLNSISPTNVIMRFAPYLFILGAAILLLAMMRRRRNAETE